MKDWLCWLWERIVCFLVGHAYTDPIGPDTIKVVKPCTFCRRLIWVYRDQLPTTYKVVRKKDGRGWWVSSAYSPRKKPGSEKPGWGTLEVASSATACSGKPSGGPAASPRAVPRGSAA